MDFPLLRSIVYRSERPPKNYSPAIWFCFQSSLHEIFRAVAMDVEVAMAMVLMTMVTILTMVLRMAHGELDKPRRICRDQLQTKHTWNPCSLYFCGPFHLPTSHVGTGLIGRPSYFQFRVLPWGIQLCSTIPLEICWQNFFNSTYINLYQDSIWAYYHLKA